MKPGKFAEKQDNFCNVPIKSNIQAYCQIYGGSLRPDIV